MRNRYELIFFVIAVYLFSNGCAGISKLTVHDFEPMPFNQYQFRELSDSLGIAIYPMGRASEAKTYLGSDLLASNVLPVFLVAENQSDASSYIIRKDRIWLIPGTTTNDSSVPSTLGSTAVGEVVTGVGQLAVIGTLAGPGAILFIPLQFVGRKMVSDANEVEYQLARKELQTRTISPNANVSGFLYFRVPENGASTNWIMHIEMLNPETKETKPFNIPFQYNRN